MTTPLIQRKRFDKFSKQLDAGIPSTEEQIQWLIHVFSALSDPNRDTNRVLGLNYTEGHSLTDEKARMKMDIVMHWVAGAISTDTSHLIDPNNDAPALGIEDALLKAPEVAAMVFGNDPDAARYNYDYLKKCWYDKEKTFRQELNRGSDSPDVFYDFPI